MRRVFCLCSGRRKMNRKTTGQDLRVFNKKTERYYTAQVFSGSTVSVSGLIMEIRNELADGGSEVIRGVEYMSGEA